MNAPAPEWNSRNPVPRMGLTWAGIALCGALQFQLAFAQPINWDEFRFLSDIYTNRRGDLTSPAQTFHVHLFGWLAGRFASEIDQIIAGRLAMLALEWLTAGLVFRICHTFAAREAALFAVLGFLSFSFVLKHGASFRYDPVATFLLMSAAVLLLETRRRLATAALAGAAAGLSGVVTVKSVLFLPLLGFIGIWQFWRSQDRRATLIRLGVMGLACACSFTALYFSHKSVLVGPGEGQAVFAASAQKTLGEGQFFSRRAEFVRSLVDNPIHWVMLALGVVTAIHRRLWIALAFLAPLTSVLFYRNAFPYFFPFMLAPGALLWAIAATRADANRYLPLLAVGVSAGALATAFTINRSVLNNQRVTLAAARSIFPISVPYIDTCSMLARSPQAGFFMSSWGMENYRATGRPMMLDAIAHRGARYIIANNRHLKFALAGSNKGGLLPEDATLLSDSFIPHWGAIWVLGKRLPASTTPRLFQLLASGSYTVESAAPVRIDGLVWHPDDVVALAAGRHYAVAPNALTLRWGDRLQRPLASPPAGALFTSF